MSARPSRPPWKEFKEALTAQGFRPSRRFGQNFLLDENTARAIVSDARVQAPDRVLEVGTGCGFLTVHLAHLGVLLLTVEVDLRLADVAEPFLDPYPHTQLLRGDILASKHALHPEVQAWTAQGTWHLVANLPYAISGPLLATALLSDHPPESVTVLVQKEMADRLIATPGQAAYGPLAIGCRWGYAGRWLRDVGGASFWPRPKVASSVVRLERRDPSDPASESHAASLPCAAPLPHASGPAAMRLAMGRIRRLFTRRRQTLKRVLGDFGAPKEEVLAWLASLGLPAETRAENLEPAQLWALAGRSGWWPAQGGDPLRD